MKSRITLVAFLFIVGSVNLFSQNVAINTSGAIANTSALLDVDATNMGVLVPRVTLTNTTDAVTIATPATSLLVYNTATAGVSPNNVVPGYYYNSGTSGAPVWVRLSTGNGPAWLLLGNAGTSPVTNFLGTTDAVDLVFRTNNTEKARIQSGGNVMIGTTTISSAKVNIVSTAAPTSNSTMYISGPGGTGFGLSGVIDIFDNQATPLRELTLGYANGAPWYGMIDMFGNSGGTEQRMGEFDFSNRTLQPADARIATITGVTPAGVTNSGSIEFITRNAGTFISNAMWINFDGKVAIGNRAPVSFLDVEGGASIGTGYAGTTASPVNGMIVEGNVGIGNSAPSQRLDVTGNVRFSGALMPNNLPGSNAQILISSGAGIAPTWTPFFMGNMGATTQIGKYYSTMSWAGTWTTGTLLTFTIIDAACTNASSIHVSIDGPWNALFSGINIQNVVTEAGQFRISAVNVGPGIVGGIPISFVAFY